LIIDNDKEKVLLYPIFTNNKTNDYRVRELDDDEFIDLEKFLVKGKYEYTSFENEFIELK
jgi:hypothetical protein